ncbi:RNA polymerase sigma factor SigJ [Paenibacillus sp. GCM10023252]|uniref:RNA polymerase sigma factor SigJ n=1 Tax=Paenibacillus sp. GCM10023252 TaxID=3252649 RepID=UPI00361DA019
MQELYTKYRGLLLKLAYQLTGSVADAEDIVQDVFVKVYDVPPERLAQPKAYLCKMVTNRCRDLYKSARRKREQYFGEWLPEPLFGTIDDGMDTVVRSDLLSYGMLVLLEKLTPSERTVFVLREALGFGYEEIAELMDKTDANCRKLYSRARAKMGISSHEQISPEPADEEWVQGFLAALEQGNLTQIVSMLDQNVVAIADGGGKANAAVNPIITREHVAQLLTGIFRKLTARADMQIEVRPMNGQLGMVFRTSEGIHMVGMLQVENNLAHHVYLIRNPDKLNQT